MPVTTVEACSIARIDRQRFNEFVAMGDYGCAPPTTPGKARRFDENDVVSLYVFAREIESGTKALIAGFLAGAVREHLNQHPDAEFCSVAKMSDGRPIRLVPTGTLIGDVVNDAWILSLTTINLAAIRRVVRDQMFDAAETGEFLG